MTKLWVILIFLPTLLWADGSFQLLQRQVVFAGLSEVRDLYVYLPEGYAKSQQRYPVLYMHDGQNLYDPARAFMGQTWLAQTTLNDLIRRKVIPPIIVIALDNTADRTNEYTPNNKGKLYLDFIVQKLKPAVDSYFKTQPGPAHTAIVGSSLGGLISLYAGFYYPKTFGLIGALSPSVWWNQKSVLQVAQSAPELPLKIYIDSGTIGGEEPDNVRALATILKQRHYSPGKDLQLIIQQGADHSERFWAMRFPETLKFLFGASKL